MLQRNSVAVDILVSNAAYQMTHENLDEISDEEWDYTFRLNVGAYFYLVKAALPHMGAGASVIGSSSVNSDMPSPTLAPYAAAKAAIANLSAGLAQLLGEKGIRVNSVAPGPIWTPLSFDDAAGKGRLFGGTPQGPGGSARRTCAGVCPSGLR